ncbi:EF-hand domain-containing protein [Kitasatospora sp. NPDC047058]|uniref:EF-hand domain-containing protein n=1 Tax=Kitasatospora sp. NPDC047058 TaxID=3155620 RepID=UPI0033E102F8
MSDDLPIAKIDHGFDRLDAYGDKLLTERDHVLMGHAVARSPGHAEGSPAEAFLAVADVDGSGTVDAGEFFVFQRGHFAGLSRDDANEAFRRLDRDGGGRLSAAEFVSGVIEFWTSRDPEAPGNWWAGKPPFAR